MSPSAVLPHSRFGARTRGGNQDGYEAQTQALHGQAGEVVSQLGTKTCRLVLALRNLCRGTI